MSQKKNDREAMNETEPEQLENAEPALSPEDPEYVERPRSARILAWILLTIVIIGVILYYLWIAGILHE